MQKKSYNKEKMYEEKIRPLLDEIAKIADEEEIPFFFTACVANSETETKYKNEMRTSEIYGFSVMDDKIPKHVNVTNGFMTVPKEQPVIIDL